MNKRTKRRYENAEQIRADIDKWKAKSQKLMDSAAALDAKADLLYKAGPELAEDARFARTQATKKRASALRIQNRKLVHLKNKLSEFMTEPIPTLLPDKSIQAN